jgi:hypothetical protein
MTYIKSAIINFTQSNSSASEAVKRIGGINVAAQRESDGFCRALQNTTFRPKDRQSYFDPFITSFCYHAAEYEQQHGLLSQWRAYGRDGGFAIAFDTKLLCDAMLVDASSHANSMASLCDVVYDGDVEKFNKEFEKLVAAIPRVIEKNFFAKLNDESASFSQILEPFINCAARLKHRGFAEESEVRAIFSPISKHWRDYFMANEPANYEKIKDKEIQTIKIRPNMSPYIEICAGHTCNSIKYIIVGPDAQKMARKDKLEKYASLSGLKFEVLVSDTPLV